MSIKAYWRVSHLGFFLLYVYSVYLFYSHGGSVRFIVNEKYEGKVKIGSSLGKGHIAQQV